MEISGSNRLSLETKVVGPSRGVVIFRFVTLDDEEALVNGFDIRNNHRFTGLAGRTSLFTPLASGPFFYARMPVTQEEATAEAKASYFKTEPTFLQLDQNVGIDINDILRKIQDPGDAVQEGSLGGVLLMHLLQDDVTGLFQDRLSLVEKVGIIERDYKPIKDVADIYDSSYNDSSRLGEVTIRMRNIAPDALAAMGSRVQVATFRKGDTSLTLETYKKYLERLKESNESSELTLHEPLT